MFSTSRIFQRVSKTSINNLKTSSTLFSSSIHTSTARFSSLSSSSSRFSTSFRIQAPKSSFNTSSRFFSTNKENPLTTNDNILVKTLRFFKNNITNILLIIAFYSLLDYGIYLSKISNELKDQGARLLAMKHYILTASEMFSDKEWSDRVSNEVINIVKYSTGEEQERKARAKEYLKKEVLKRLTMVRETIENKGEENDYEEILPRQKVLTNIQEILPDDADRFYQLDEETDNKDDKNIKMI